MSPLEAAAVVAASAVGGAMNAMAGGGTIVTFPTLVFLGEPAIMANATSAVALWPGAAASLFGYRREVREHASWLATLFLPSLAGGALGAFLLLQTPPRQFERLAPWLVLFATLLFLVQGLGGRRRREAPAPRTAGRTAAAWLFQLATATYGGYFGAGIGILMLAVLGFLGLRDIHAANGVKNFFAMCINGVAAGYFIVRGAVDWPIAGVMVVGAIVGGYAGARFARRIGRDRARAAVVVIGLAVTVLLLVQHSR
jgi:uncharacterized membrane protein YfcA